MPRKINILYIIDYFHRTGGTERHLAELVRHLPKELFDCSIVVFDLGSNVLIEEMRMSGISVTHIPVAREYTWNALVQAQKLATVIKSRRVDIIQTFHQKADTYGAVIAKLSGARCVISSKRDIGDLKAGHHVIANRLLRPIFTRFIVVANAVADVIVSREGIQRSRIVRIYNGVDPLKWSPPTQSAMRIERERLGFADRDFVVGIVAGFRPEKSHNVFFTGALKAMATIPRLKVLAVGAGPLLEDFQTRYLNEIAQGTFVLPGAVPDVVRYLSTLDVGCLLPTENEGFSNAVLEKMAMGLPLIVTDVGGNAEAVVDHWNGLVIPANDADAFCTALVAMYSDRAMRLEMGRRSRQMVEERFTLERMCKEHEALYLSLTT